MAMIKAYLKRVVGHFKDEESDQKSQSNDDDLKALSQMLHFC